MGGLLDREVMAAAREIARRLRQRRRVWVVLESDGRVVVLLIVALLALLAGCAPVPSNPAAARATEVRVTATARAAVPPEAAWIRGITVLEWHLDQSSIGSWYAIGELRNDNAIALGPHLLFTAYDKDGHVVDSADCWPASVRNVPARATWPINCLITTKPGVTRATLRVIGVDQW